MLKKIGVIGGGNIGGVLVQEIARRGLAKEVGLMDILPPDFAKGKCLDISEGTPILGLDVRVNGGKEYDVLEGAELVINTAGVPRKKRPDGTIPTREELLKTNLNITAQVAGGIMKYAKNATVISLANPLDAIVYTLNKRMSPPKNKLMGMAGVLDSARYRYFVAEAAGVSVTNVEALVLGGHGDTMVPIRSCCRVGGMPVEKFVGKEELEALESWKLSRPGPARPGARSSDCSARDRPLSPPPGRRSRWPKRSSTTARRSFPSARCSKVSTGSTACSSACPASSAQAASRR
jgi:malate dehydrogenase